MPRLVSLALVLMCFTAAPAAAQERFPRLPAQPTAWGSLTVGLYRLPTIFDPPSSADWDFGSIVQFRGTLEREFRRGSALGVALSFARAPLTYDGPDCNFCDADVALWQALAVFRIGGGAGRGFGLHQIIEIAAGVTGFSNFDRRDGGDLAASNTIDPTISIGYGLGYALSPTVHFMLMQEVGLLVHRRGDRPAGDESNLPGTYATRIGLRAALGGWR